MDADAIARHIDRLERGFPGWTLAESLHAVRLMRGHAGDTGLHAARTVADALVDALGREGRGVMLASWLWCLREALRVPPGDREAGRALVATVAVRFAA